MATADECVAEFLVTHRDHINGQDTEQQYEATKSIREKLSMLGGRMTQDIFISGLVPRFVEFLRKESAPVSVRIVAFLRRGVDHRVDIDGCY